ADTKAVHPVPPTLFFHSNVPEHSPSAQLYFLHGYGDHCGRYEQFYEFMIDNGVACHVLDFRGHGKSEGKCGFVRKWTEYLDDLEALLEARPPAQFDVPTFFLGHSHGGLVLAHGLLAGILPPLAGCIFSSPYFQNAVHVSLPKRVFSQTADAIWPSLPIPNGIEPEWLSSDPKMVEDARNDPLLLNRATPRWFLATRKKQEELMERVSEISVPLLLIGGDDDRLADSHAWRTFVAKASSTDKQIEIYPEMRHELLREKDRTEVFERILAWITTRSQCPREGSGRHDCSTRM
ncbi:MAG: alpha-beta hydrolase superfamily lysophospholipase, partial [Verrucomicrobiales bacterium]